MKPNRNPSPRRAGNAALGSHRPAASAGGEEIQAMQDYRLVPLAELPTADGQLPKYPYVLVDAEDWHASTANETEGLPAFADAIRNGLGSEVVYVRELAPQEPAR